MELKGLLNVFFSWVDFKQYHGIPKSSIFSGFEFHTIAYTGIMYTRGLNVLPSIGFS